MSGARVLIVGQGLAGTALGLELEAAGVDVYYEAAARYNEAVDAFLAAIPAGRREN